MSNVNHVTWQGIPGVIKPKRDQRMAQWEELNYGMFIHWGLYSKIGGVWEDEPVTKGYSEQIQMWANISEEDYLKVASQFTADQFDADEICQLAKDAGMTYVLMTTKHHDGFCMFDTKTTDYNIVEKTPYGKDPLKLLSEACERHGLKFGIYYSLVDWHQGHEFDYNNNNPIPEHIEKIIEDQLDELLTNYGEICEIWFDMSSPTIEQSQKLIDIVRHYQPHAAINSRIWNNMGDFRTLDDNEVPTVTLDGPWQTPASIYRETWGYRDWQVREDLKGKVKDLLQALVGDGNYLLNIGPRGDGSIVPFETEVLQEIGQWLKRHPNMEGLKATAFDKPTWGKVKENDGSLYLMIEERPENNTIELDGLVNNVKTVVEDGQTDALTWSRDGSKLQIELPNEFKESILPVIKVTIEDDLTVIPNKTFLLENDKTIIDVSDCYTGHGYHEEGNYNSMQQVIVRYTTYLVSHTDESIQIVLKGKAANDKQYKVCLGQIEQKVSGQSLTEGKPLTFNLQANKVEAIHITLADPSHSGEPIQLELETIEINRV